MTLSSMTGFARRDGAEGAVRWHWELRSVNSRGLDLRLRLPPGYDSFEPKIRDAAQRRIVRGSLSVTLVVQRSSGGTEIRVNEAALHQVLIALDRVRARGDFAKSSPEAVLALRGVMEVGEPADTEAETEQRSRLILADFEAALVQLVDARAQEGQRLALVLGEQVHSIETIAAAVAASPARAPDSIRRRLEDQVRRLTDASPALEPGRLHQEAMLLAARADIEEELARLKAHVAAARELISAKEPSGRKLDFLAQEFNREANTLCSKANDVDITRLGLALKAVIDQLREQVQNIE